MKHSTRNLTGPLAGLSCAILIALLLNSPVLAQYRDYGTPPLSGGIKVGGLLGQTESELSDKVDLEVRGYLSHGFTEKLSAEIGGGYGILAAKDDAYKTHLGLADLRFLYTPFQFSRLSPFAYAGAGMLRYDVDRIPVTRTPDADLKGWATIVPVGVGVKYRLVGGLSLEMSGGYTHTFRDDLNATVLGKRDDTFLGAKLGFDLARHPDPDRDGLYKKAEKRYGTNPRLNDTDGDGLADGDEVRKFRTHPLKADSDGDGLSDSDEVAMGTDPRKTDTDGDGLSDSDEVAMGTDPRKTDTDGDGVDDRSELLAGTDPLAAPSAIVLRTLPAPVAQTPIAVHEKKVGFSHGQAALSPEMKGLLDQVAAYLSENPAIRMEIRGHSNDPRDVGYKLSQKRAETVMNYLVQQGVDSSQLQARGMGAQHPVASGATEEGRQQNRRVDFVTMQ